MFRPFVMGFVLSLGIGASSLWTASAQASLLDFEVTPSGAVPTDDQPLAAPYALEEGSVRFFFDANSNNTFDAGTDLSPVFERVGPDSVDGFRSTYNHNSLDRARPGYEAVLGNYFLRYPADFQVKDVGNQPFVIDYAATVPIHELSGEIWDIDSAAGGMEQWRLEVLDAAGGVLASQLSPVGINQSSPDSLDSLPWSFQFRELPSGVDKLRIKFVGTKTTGLGFALNNFSPTEAVPEPSAMLLASCGAMLLCAWRGMASLARGCPGGHS